MRTTHTHTFGEKRLIAFAEFERPGLPSLDTPRTVDERMDRLQPRVDAAYAKKDELVARAKAMLEKLPADNPRREQVRLQYNAFVQKFNQHDEMYAHPETSPFNRYGSIGARDGYELERSSILSSLARVLSQFESQIRMDEESLKQFLALQKRGTDMKRVRWNAVTNPNRKNLASALQEKTGNEFIQALENEINGRHGELGADKNIPALFKERTDAVLKMRELSAADPRVTDTQRFDLTARAIAYMIDEREYLEKNHLENIHTKRVEELTTLEEKTKADFSMEAQTLIETINNDKVREPKDVARYHQQIGQILQNKEYLPDEDREKVVKGLVAAQKGLTTTKENREGAPFAAKSNKAVQKMRAVPTDDNAAAALTALIDEGNYLKQIGREGTPRFEALRTEYHKLKEFQTQRVALNAAMTEFGTAVAPNPEALRQADANVRQINSALLALYKVYPDNSRAAETATALSKVLKEKGVESVLVADKGAVKWESAPSLKSRVGPFINALRQSVNDFAAGKCTRTELELNIAQMNEQLPAIDNARPDMRAVFESFATEMSGILDRNGHQLVFDGKFRVREIKEKADSLVDRFRETHIKGVDAAKEEFLSIAEKEKDNPDGVAAILVAARKLQGKLAEATAFVGTPEWKRSYKHLALDVKSDIQPYIDYHASSAKEVLRLIDQLEDLQVQKKPASSLGSKFGLLAESPAQKELGNNVLPEAHVNQFTKPQVKLKKDASDALKASNADPTDLEKAKTAYGAIAELRASYLDENTALNGYDRKKVRADVASAMDARQHETFVLIKKLDATKAKMEERVSKLAKVEEEKTDVVKKMERERTIADKAADPEKRQSVYLDESKRLQGVTDGIVDVTTPDGRVQKWRAIQEELTHRKKFNEVVEKDALSYVADEHENTERMKELQKQAAELQPKLVEDTKERAFAARLKKLAKPFEDALQKYQKLEKTPGATDDQKEEARKKIVAELASQQLEIGRILEEKTLEPAQAMEAENAMLRVSVNLRNWRSEAENEEHATVVLQNAVFLAKRFVEGLRSPDFVKLPAQERGKLLEHARQAYAQLHTVQRFALRSNAIDSQAEATDTLADLEALLRQRTAQHEQLSNSVNDREHASLIARLKAKNVSLWDSEKYDAYPTLAKKADQILQVLSQVQQSKALSKLMKEFGVRIIIANEDGNYTTGSVKDAEGKQCISIKASMEKAQVFQLIQQTLKSLEAAREEAAKAPREFTDQRTGWLWRTRVEAGKQVLEVQFNDGTWKDFTHNTTGNTRFDPPPENCRVWKNQ